MFVTNGTYGRYAKTANKDKYKSKIKVTKFTKFIVWKIGVSKRKLCINKNSFPTNGIPTNIPIKILYKEVNIAYKIDRTNDCTTLYAKNLLIGFLTTK